MDQLLLYMFIYRTLIVLAGILSIYWGYKLFYVMKLKQGEFKVKTGENYEVSMSDVAPGVFFALFGAGIIIVSLINGITVKPAHHKEVEEAAFMQEVPTSIETIEVDAPPEPDSNPPVDK
ncbi:hypothetical protein [Pseudomonas sp. PLMAX]|uniref:hypothetical protein n=1 Tax=Pseudomonas sp. PLMAX TaxID=2201998 RepID=UPI0038B7098F